MELLSHAEVMEDRRTAEANMQDRVQVTREAVAGDAEYVARELDPATGKYPDQGRVIVYEGRCRVQVKADINSNVVETTAGDREWTYLTLTLQAPIVAVDDDAIGQPGDVRPDHIAEILTARDDETLVGRQFNVQGIYHKSQATCRRWRIRDVIS